MSDREIRIALVPEGSSDAGFIYPIMRYVSDKFDTGCVSFSLDFKGTVREKLEKCVEDADGFDILVIHRDSDSQGYEQRLTEITDPVADSGLTVPVVPLIAVRMTEALLLSDPDAIEEVIGVRSQGWRGFDLPSVSSVERIADPKTTLNAAFLHLGGKTGARLKDERRKFSRRRRSLLENMDPMGSVSAVQCWRDFQQYLDLAVQAALSSAEAPHSETV